MEDLIKKFMSIDGSGDGSGYGTGDGYGSGTGDGYGYVKKTNKSKYKKGFLDKEIHKLSTFKGKDVYYIDNIPCCFLAIVGNMAKVEIIKDDFSTKVQYIAKSGNLFAHGDSKEHALRSVSEKFFASLSFAEKKEEFIKLFRKDVNYSNQLFFEWHHYLTGSCESGRRMFSQSRSIDLNSEMNVMQFLELTKNEYNGSIIKEIIELIK